MPASIIMSNKPSPAMLATDTFDEELVRADLRRTIDAAHRNGKKLENMARSMASLSVADAVDRITDTVLEYAGKGG